MNLIKHRDLTLTPEDIKETLDKYRGKWLLSYNDSQKIRNIFKDFNIDEVLVKYTIQRTGTCHRKELLISNY